MKVAGIMGGMGPGTTADFYREVNTLAEQQGREDRPELLILNVPLNYQVEQTLLTEQQGLEKYTPYLVDAAKKLEAAGSDFIAVPCNTVHELYSEFSSAVNVPVLHIVQETAARLQSQEVDEVALLATGQTIGSRLYQGVLTDAGIGYRIPGDSDQERLNTIVATLVTGEGAAEGQANPEAEWLNELVDGYVADVGAVVLGCTDFHIMLEDPDAMVIDSTQVLAEAVVEKIYGE